MKRFLSFLFVLLLLSMAACEPSKPNGPEIAAVPTPTVTPVESGEPAVAPIAFEQQRKDFEPINLLSYGGDIHDSRLNEDAQYPLLVLDHFAERTYIDIPKLESDQHAEEIQGIGQTETGLLELCEQLNHSYDTQIETFHEAVKQFGLSDQLSSHLYQDVQ